MMLKVETCVYTKQEDSVNTSVFVFRSDHEVEKSIDILSVSMGCKRGTAVKRVIIEAAKRLAKNRTRTNKRAMQS